MVSLILYFFGNIWLRNGKGYNFVYLHSYLAYLILIAGLFPFSSVVSCDPLSSIFNGDVLDGEFVVTIYSPFSKPDLDAGEKYLRVESTSFLRFVQKLACQSLYIQMAAKKNKPKGWP